MGKVYLVGAGPGDPELLSLKAFRLLKEADVILVDELVLGVRDMIPPGKRVIDVGKSGKEGGKRTSQAEINRLMVELARKYECVVRLKGGDPFIFGRGGEEAEFLREHGVEFEVVPGISAATAVPAFFGIPLTHREYASSLTILTGHGKEEGTGEERESVNWSAVAKLRGTIVILMGVGTLERNVRRLLEAGMPAETPVAILEKGFTSEARAIVGTLGDIVEKARSVEPPAVVVIGNVVRLREKLL
ncbi:MAG: uroporphyrinogen-III C-methyltransferase [Candidatus Methanospirare jalkutatii]|nr:uroporphyrinogen-III C-methyltransferase [Candidatus Methanospirare jalkutatii]